MLVLSRKPSQSIFINTGDGIIQIKVVKQIGSRVKIGVEAPRSMNVVRGEFVEQLGLAMLAGNGSASEERLTA